MPCLDIFDNGQKIPEMGDNVLERAFFRGTFRAKAIDKFPGFARA